MLKAAGPQTVRDLFEDFYRPQRLLMASPRTLAECRSTLSRLAVCFGREIFKDELDDEHVSQFLEWYAARGCAAATLEKQRRTLSAWARFCSHPRRGWVAEPLSLAMGSGQPALCRNL